MPRIVFGFMGWHTCGRHPARRQSWPGPGRLRFGARVVAGSSSDDGGAAVPGQEPGPDGLLQCPADLPPGWPGVARVDRQGRDVAVLGERPARAGQITAALQPRVQLVQAVALWPLTALGMAAE